MSSSSPSPNHPQNLEEEEDSLPNKKNNDDTDTGSQTDKAHEETAEQDDPPTSRVDPVTPSIISPNDVLPSNVSTREQLALVPEECLSSDPSRPLLHRTEQGHEFHYALNPMNFSVAFILIVELLERFAFYGIYYTQTLYLTGAYNSHWNAGFSSVQASSFVSMSTMVAYTTPFCGAFLADSVWGDYKSILIGLLVFYVPGVLLVAVTTIPYFLGAEEFNQSLLAVGLLFLWPMGTGIIKSIVNVFGAKQFHPILQSSLIERYYVNFYMAINIGALAGIGIVPIMAQWNVSYAYFGPLTLLALGVLFFSAGTPFYIISPPQQGGHGSLLGRNDRNHAIDDRDEDHGHRVGETRSTSGKKTNKRPKRQKHAPSIPLWQIFRISLLIVPFCVGYNQMPTTFIVQGTVMNKAFGFLDVASMNCLDAISVLFFGYVTSSFLYPFLARRGIKIPTTYKFAMGSALGALAILWALYVERMIHQAYELDGSKINVLWQAPSYLLIGWGEIFAVSTAYEVAFTASSPDKKALASATNIFCVGGLPNFLCIVLYHSCSVWFRNAHGSTRIEHLKDYATANVYKYFWVLFGVMMLGVAVNLLDCVRDFVLQTEAKAAEIVKTPVVRKSPASRHREGLHTPGEASPLLGTPDSPSREAIMRYGEGPVLYKMGSMRAGPALSNNDKLPGAKPKPIQYKYIPSLYHSDEASTPGYGLVTGLDGKPITVGTIMKRHASDASRFPLDRTEN